MKIREWWKNLKNYNKAGIIFGVIYMGLNLLLRYFSHRGFLCVFDLRGGTTGDFWIIELIPALVGVCVVVLLGAPISLIYPTSRDSINMIIHSEFGRALFSIVFELLGSTILIIILSSWIFKIIFFSRSYKK